MTYRPEEYQVTSVNYAEDGSIRSFDVNIKGANFIVYRQMNKFQPTRTFKFNKNIQIVPKKENGKIIGAYSVEIDWDTCLAGMLHLAQQMGLKCIPGVSVFANNKRLTQFVEVGDA